jgi:hypothetical protein
MDKIYIGLGDPQNIAILQAEHLIAGTLKTSTITMILASQTRIPSLSVILLLWSGRQLQKLVLASLSGTKITVKHFMLLQTIIQPPISLASTQPMCSEGQIDSNRIYQLSNHQTEKS